MAATSPGIPGAICDGCGARGGASEFKLNNNYRAGYARLIMAQEADLAGFFETRESKFDVDAPTRESAA